MASAKHHRRKFLQLGLGATAGLISSGMSCAPQAQSSDPSSLSDAQPCGNSPQQTIGPFYPHVKNGDGDVDLTTIQGQPGQAEGEVILVRGRILDEACDPIPQALVEIWQANHHGRYAHEGDANNPRPLDPNFEGWGEMTTDARGQYGFRTIKPAAYPIDPANPDEWRTPHIHFRISRRGYHELVTQMYFDGETLNEEDFILNDLSAADQASVVLSPQPDEAGIPVFTFDLHLRQVSTAKDRQQALADCAGHYDLRVPFGQGGDGVEIRTEAEALYLDIPGYTTVELQPTARDEYQALAISRRFVFNRSENGLVNSVTMHPVGQVEPGVPVVGPKR